MSAEALHSIRDQLLGRTYEICMDEYRQNTILKSRGSLHWASPRVEQQPEAIEIALTFSDKSKFPALGDVLLSQIKIIDSENDEIGLVVKRDDEPDIYEDEFAQIVLSGLAVYDQHQHELCRLLVPEIKMGSESLFKAYERQVTLFRDSYAGHLL
jgi:hypothetical protein